MMDIITVVSKGKLSENAYYNIRRFLETMNGKTIHIRMESKKATRSLKQNNYYWYMMEFIAKELGYDGEFDSEISKELLQYVPNSMKNRAKLVFSLIERPKLGKDEMHEIFKELLLDGKPTSSLSVEEAEEYYKQIRLYCSKELGIVVPEPNQQEWL